jgi:hypothetical protein
MILLIQESLNENTIHINNILFQILEPYILKNEILALYIVLN